MFKNLNLKELNTLRKNSKSGFSLMELIVVIVIIGILISAVIGLSGQKETAKAAAAEEVIMQVSNATQSWATQRALEDFTSVNIAALKTGGILPNNFTENRANPWGGTITVAVAANTVPNFINHYTISLTNVPTEVCPNLVNKYINKTFAAAGAAGSTCTATSGSNTFAATF
jgi:prepilin-type N-terminal cleavage/methylation domain-containing protein